MMKKVWNFCKEKNLAREKKLTMFLMLHMVAWCVIGAVVWRLISRIVLKDMLWLFLFIGYAGVFPGLIGGTLYAMNLEDY